MLNNMLLSPGRTPVSRALLETAIICSGLLPLVLAFKRSTPTDPLALGVALLAMGLAYAGWRLSPSFPVTSSSSKPWLMMSGAGALLGFAAVLLAKASLASCAVWLILPTALLFAHSRTTRDQRAARHLLVPALFGSAIMFGAAVIGAPVVGAFPAVIGTLFVGVLRATLDIEEDVLENHADEPAMAVEHHYRHRLAWTAVIFFLFGTVSLWPWLGELYSRAYFWITLLAVLLPLAFFWGRIRQPKMEGARVALIRFNRIAPMLGLFHMIALLVS